MPETAQLADLGAVGWICFTLIWLGTVILVCQTALAFVRLIIRHRERYMRPVQVAGNGVTEAAASRRSAPVRRDAAANRSAVAS